MKLRSGAIAPRRVRTAFVVALSAALIECACQGGTPMRQTLLLSLPPLPEAWGNADCGYEVVWTNSSGVQVSAPGLPGGELEIEIPRGLSQAICVYPVVGSVRLRPAGCLYPLHVEAPPQVQALVDCLRFMP